ncbi:hypothetical protein BJF83_13145 [Nocardiopsis sp. CNR-923]|uniref:hypothetical protein n=1 Tax=Nocardiopsis sp. CNR-923 TaxID=1904965 RepID=UPI000968126F|nr:hypothetical protein [Nocardiopsis sp. CNR-923]OLT29042.1 hypothetical protein BJF83_13145 [Nocardiopsis sp. CNR-923]
MRRRRRGEGLVMPPHLAVFDARDWAGGDGESADLTKPHPSGSVEWTHEAYRQWKAARRAWLDRHDPDRRVFDVVEVLQAERRVRLNLPHRMEPRRFHTG